MNFNINKKEILASSELLLARAGGGADLSQKINYCFIGGCEVAYVK